MSVRKQNAWAFLCWFFVLAGLGAQIVAYIPKITNYPFPISWSESGRIFNAYQIYAPLLSGKNLSWPWLDPGRSILDGIVLLLSGTQIWMYRFWISLLMLAGNFAASVLVVGKAVSFASLRKEKLTKGLIWLLIFWGTLFLLQGPIYYHVLLGILPVLWFYDPKKPISTLIVIVISSMWEGLSRVNWFLMPATLAVLFYVLRTPFPREAFWKYIKWPLIYLVSGGISSFTVYLTFINETGFVIPFLNPNMDYAFFLYKFWPNNGFMGLLPGTGLLTLPVLLIVTYGIWKYRRNIHWMRLLIILCVLGIFFVGSMAVSIRAGGGYDLHNYDSIILLLFVCGCFFGMDAILLDKVRYLEHVPFTSYVVLVSILLIPVLFSYSRISLGPYKPSDQTEQTLSEIRQVIQDLGDSSGNHPVLFIDQRQLLVYQMIEEVNFYVPYEKIELMEMAMARNYDYKSQFVEDLENQKFSLIVSEVLRPWVKGFEPTKFERDWYENNMWVDFVAIPVLNYYYPVYENKVMGIAIYAPK